MFKFFSVLFHGEETLDEAEVDDLVVISSVNDLDVEFLY